MDDRRAAQYPIEEVTLPMTWTSLGVTYLRMLFPDPATKLSVMAGDWRTKRCTFSIDPQQGTGRFPINIGTIFNEPCRGPLVVGGTRSVEVYGRVWGKRAIF
jgi:hypothetical protein